MIGAGTAPFFAAREESTMRWVVGILVVATIAILAWVGADWFQQPEEQVPEQAAQIEEEAEDLAQSATEASREAAEAGTRAEGEEAQTAREVANDAREVAVEAERLGQSTESDAVAPAARSSDEEATVGAATQDQLGAEPGEPEEVTLQWTANSALAALVNVEDEASAQAALPTVETLNEQIDRVAETQGGEPPAEDKTAAREALPELRSEAERIRSNEPAWAVLGERLDEAMASLEQIAGEPQ
jgi:hypothetical protein